MSVCGVGVEIGITVRLDSHYLFNHEELTATEVAIAEPAICRRGEKAALEAHSQHGASIHSEPSAKILEKPVLDEGNSNSLHDGLALLRSWRTAINDVVGTTSAKLKPNSDLLVAGRVLEGEVFKATGSEGIHDELLLVEGLGICTYLANTNFLLPPGEERRGGK